jgi:serine/threonine protein kinase, bacterial
MESVRFGRAWLRLAAGAAALCAAITLSGGGSPASATPSQQTVPFTGLGDPIGVAVDAAGDVFVVDNASKSVLEDVNADSSYTQVTLPFSNLQNPVGVAVDAAGDVFVTDSTVSGHVIELPDTNDGYQPGSEVYLPIGGLDDPTGIASDPSGDLYVVNSNHFLDENYDPIVLYVQKTGSGYTNNQVALPFGGLLDPQGVAYDGTGVYVADSGNQRVLYLAKAGQGYAPQVTLPFGGLVDPVGVAAGSCLTYGPRECIYVSDAENAENAPVRYIQKAPIVGYTGQQNAPFGDVVSPDGLAVQSNGSVYLTDSGYPRVLMLAGPPPPSLFGHTGK